MYRLSIINAPFLCENSTFMKQCYFCSHKIEMIDYKDAYLLRRFMNSLGKIYPPKKHGTCATHQRELARAIKRSRIMALIPFTTR